jgi:hypothetical protein
MESVIAYTHERKTRAFLCNRAPYHYFRRDLFFTIAGGTDCGRLRPLWYAYSFVYMCVCVYMQYNDCMRARTRERERETISAFLDEISIRSYSFYRESVTLSAKLYTRTTSHLTKLRYRSLGESNGRLSLFFDLKCFSLSRAYKQTKSPRQCLGSS